MMPSVGQCETVQNKMAALPSSLEIFDKFKTQENGNDNGKDSDSEESFHLQLDDDDTENRSNSSSGRASTGNQEENEDDILNKFDTSFKSISPDFDIKNEDCLLNDLDSTDTNGKSENECDSNVENCTSETNSIISGKHESNCKPVLVEIKESTNKDKHEDLWKEGEFRSDYELEVKDSEDNEPNIELTEEVDALNNVPNADDSNHSFHSASENLLSTEALINGENVCADSAISNSVNGVLEECSGQKTKIEHVEMKSEYSGTKEIEKSEDNSLQKSDIPFTKECPNRNSSENMTSEDVEMKTEHSEDKDNTNPEENILKESVKVEEGSNQIDEDVEMELDYSENTDDTRKLKGANCNACSTESETVSSLNETEIDRDTTADVAMIGDHADEKTVDTDMDLRKSEDSYPLEKELVDSDEPMEEPSSEIANNVIKEEKSHDGKNILEVDASFESKEEQNIPNLSSEPTGEEASDDSTTISLDNDQPKSQSKLSGNAKGPSIEEDFCDEVLTEPKDEIDYISSGPKNHGHNTKITLKIISSENDDSHLPDTKLADISELPTETTDLKKVENADLNEYVEIGVEDVIENGDIDDENKEKVTGMETTDSKKLINEISEENAEESVQDTNMPDDDKTTIENVPNNLESNVCVEKKTDTKIARVDSDSSEDNSSKSDANKDEPKAENENSCDDDENLLDISIIRDADEDDACAMATAIADQDAQENEKSDEEPTDLIEEQDHVEDDDIDDDRQDAEPLVFEDDDTNIDIEQENHDLLDTDSHDVSSNDTNFKDQDTIEETKDVDSDNKTEENKNNDMTVEINQLVEEEMNLISTIEEPSKEKVPEDEPQLIIDADDSQSAHHQQSESINIDDESNESTTQTNKTDSLEKAKKIEDAPSLTDKMEDEKNVDAGVVVDLENRRISGKRNLSTGNDDENQASAQKKRKISGSSSLDTTIPVAPSKVKTLGAFAKYMQCKKFTSKLSRSDLEQFCIQKICETFIAKSEEGEFHHTIKKQEKLIDGLRKDLQQLAKQCKDLEIVNKKLMNELRNQNSSKKPLVPLKITRSVGLQVRLTTNNEPNIVINTKKRQNSTPAVVSPQKQVPQRVQPTSYGRPRIMNIAPTSPVVTQVSPAPSPQKSPLVTASPTVQTAPTTNNTILSQALQTATPANNNRRTNTAIVAKRTATPVRQNYVVEPAKPSNPGVIDLTDEDDKRPATVPAGHLKIVNKGPNGANTGKTIPLNKVVNKPTVANQMKLNVPNKSLNKVAAGGATPTRVNLQPGVRLTPGSVINTSTAGGSPQMLYVLPSIGNAGGGQKIAFVNIPASASGLNGSAVMSKPITLKTVGTVRKHPAPLPAPPRLPPDPLLRPVPPKPHLTIKKIDTGIILQWKMPYNLDQYEGIASYQLYAYQETNAPPNTDMWRKVGDVKALALPMACTLTQFADKNKYYFAVRSVDVHKRIGAFSDPEEISL